MEYTSNSQRKMERSHMQLVGLGNTRIFAHYAPKSPRTLRATSHKRLRAHNHYTSSTLSLVEKAEPVQVHFTLRLRDQRSMRMQDGCKVYMDSYMASNWSCFMAAWSVFKNYLLEVDLTQIQETVALRTLTTVDLFYFVVCENPHE